MPEEESCRHDIDSDFRLNDLLNLKKQSVFTPGELHNLATSDLLLLEAFYRDEAEHCTAGVPLDTGIAEANLLAVRDQIERKKKTTYFTQISLQAKKALELHKQAGLWERKGGKRDWGNVSEHCLAETARVMEFSTLLKLSPALENNLMLAAAAHDYNKKEEIGAMKTAGKTGTSELTASMEADAHKTQRMRKAGFNDEIVRLANAVGGHPAELIECKRLLDKQELTEDDIAYLVLHYVDDVTQGSDWVKASDGEKNNIDYRIEATQQKSGYSVVGEEITVKLQENDFFKGMDTAKAMAAVSHLIEQRLAALIKEKNDIDIEPLKIPEYIDQKIRERIQSMP